MTEGESQLKIASKQDTDGSRETQIRPLQTAMAFLYLSDELSEWFNQNGGLQKHLGVRIDVEQNQYMVRSFQEGRYMPGPTICRFRLE